MKTAITLFLILQVYLKLDLALAHGVNTSEATTYKPSHGGYPTKELPHRFDIPKSQEERLSDVFSHSLKIGLHTAEEVPLKSIEQIRKETKSSLEKFMSCEEAQSVTEDCLSKRHSFSEIRKHLTIDLPIDEIERNFENYRVIQLRSFKSDKLVIGCGLNNSSHRHRCPHDRSRGGSDQFDTLSVDATYNPSVVAFWGDPTQCRVFEQRKFRILIDEGPVISFVKDKDGYWQCARMALEEGGTILLPDHALENTSIPSDFVKISGRSHARYSCHVSTEFKYVPRH